MLGCAERPCTVELSLTLPLPLTLDAELLPPRGGGRTSGVEADVAIDNGGTATVRLDVGGDAIDAWEDDGEVASLELLDVVGRGTDELLLLAAAAADSELEDCDRWRIDSSEGLRLRSWLLDDRWPGVWLRTGGMGLLLPPTDVLALDVLVVLADRSRSSRRRRCPSVLLVLAAMLALLLMALVLLDEGGAVEGGRGGALLCSSITVCVRELLERCEERGV